MDKVIKVSISGISFTLEEEADAILTEYLDTLSAHYRSNPCGNEIMEGIESRISELLTDRGCRNFVVTGATAKEVINIIGKPEELFDSPGDDGAQQPRTNHQVKKRFYRNPEGKIAGGVCSGIGAYFNIDPLWPRLFFMVLGIAGIAFDDWWDFSPLCSVLIYCVLCLIMPTARTSEQKAWMRGESMSLDGIEKKATSGPTDPQSGADKVLSAIAKVLLIFFGCIFFLAGFTGICALTCIMLGLGVAGLAMPAVLSELIATLGTIPTWAHATIKVLSCIVTFLPFAALLYGGVKLLFNFKTPRWKPGLLMLLVWLAALVALLIIGIATVPNSWNSMFDVV